MRTLEFDAEISEERTLKIPQELAEQVSSHQSVHVILVVRDGDKEDEKAAAVMATFGSCKDDESLVNIFETIDEERRAYVGREVNIT